MAKTRIERLALELDAAGVDAFFAQDSVSMGYLHGFHEGGHERFLTLGVHRNGDVRMICPALSESQARRSGLQNIQSWRDSEDPLLLFQTLADDWNLESAIVAVDGNMPARMLLQMQSVLPAALFRSGEEYLGALMRSKDSAELDLMRRAGQIADEALLEVRPKIEPGQSEQQVAQMLNNAMAELGGVPAFAIVATGKNSAEPHHLSDATILRESDVLILDFGCTFGGYYSDITRTVCLGDATPKAQEVYEIVYRAHMAGRTAISPGASGEDVDAAARQVIVEAGYGPYFVHRTGHGIGMNGHEAPFIIAGNSVPLAPGNCFSIEPGIYLPGELGVRIENIVVATEQGHETLNAEPEPRLMSCG